MKDSAAKNSKSLSVTHTRKTDTRNQIGKVRIKQPFT